MGDDVSICPSPHPPFLPSSPPQVCDDYDVQQKEFYFDRNPGLFPCVLHFYQTGRLHIVEELCVFSFRSGHLHHTHIHIHHVTIAHSVTY